MKNGNKKQKIIEYNIFELFNPDIWAYLCIPTERHGQPLLSINELMVLSMTSKQMYDIVQNNIPWEGFLRAPKSIYKGFENATYILDSKHIYNGLVKHYKTSYHCCICFSSQIVPQLWAYDYNFSPPICITCWQSRLGGEFTYESKNEWDWPKHKIRVSELAEMQEVIGKIFTPPRVWFARPGSTIASEVKYSLKQELTYTHNCIHAALKLAYDNIEITDDLLDRVLKVFNNTFEMTKKISLSELTDYVQLIYPLAITLE